MIQKNLKTFVLQNRRLIIPSLGAFLTKEMEDGNKRIIFSSFLKYDDEGLKKCICEKENVSAEVAEKEIGLFVSDILGKLDKNEKFIIPEFGYFEKDNQGVTSFIVENCEPEVVEQNEALKENKAEETAENKAEYEKPKGEEKIEDKPKHDKIPVQIVPSAKPQPQKNVDKKKEDSRKKVAIWILSTILFIILLAVLLYFFDRKFKNKVNDIICTETVKNTTIVNDKSDNNPQKELTLSDSVPEAPKTDSVPTVVTKVDLKYKIIAGCFINKDNAESLAEKLKLNGLEARVSDKKIGNLHPVIAGESDNLNEADSIREKCLHLGYDVWIK